MLVSGMLPTVIAAKTLAQRDADQAHETFIADAGDVASTLKLGILQAEGLVINSGAYVVNVHQSTEMLGKYVSCGDIGTSAAPAPLPTEDSGY